MNVLYNTTFLFNPIQSAAIFLFNPARSLGSKGGVATDQCQLNSSNLKTSNSFLKKLVRRQHSFLRHKRITFIGQNYVTHLQQLLFVS